MTSAGEAIVNELLRDIRAHGFTKLRVTTHGTIYGLDRFRISLPNNMPDKGHNSLQERLRKRWAEVKSEAYGALPGLKARVLERNGHGGMSPSDVEQMQPIETIEPGEEVPHAEATVVTMAGWQCPKCGKKLKHPGRHVASCGRQKAPRKTQSKRSTEAATNLLDRLKDIVLRLAAERDRAVTQLAAVKSGLKAK